MPDNIIFNTIPTDIRTPGQYVEIDNSKALRAAVAQPPHPGGGQQPPTGTAAPLTLYRVNSGDEGATLFGRGSVLHEMLRLAHGQQDERYLGAECRRPRGRCRRYQDHHRHRPRCRRRHDRPYINGQKLSIGGGGRHGIGCRHGYRRSRRRLPERPGQGNRSRRRGDADGTSQGCLHPGYRRVGQLLRRRVPAGWPDSGDRQRRGRHRQSGRGRRGGSDLRRMVLHHHFALERFREHGDH